MFSPRTRHSCPAGLLQGASSLFLRAVFWEFSIPSKLIPAELCSAADGFLLSHNNLGHFFSLGTWCHSTSSFRDFVPYGGGRHRNAAGRSSWVQVKLQSWVLDVRWMKDPGTGEPGICPGACPGHSPVRAGLLLHFPLPLHDPVSIQDHFNPW